MSALRRRTVKPRAADRRRRRALPRPGRGPAACRCACAAELPDLRRHVEMLTAEVRTLLAVVHSRDAVVGVTAAETELLTQLARTVDPCGFFCAEVMGLRRVMLLTDIFARCGITSAARLGQLLHRFRGKAVGEFVVESDRRTRRGLHWRIRSAKTPRDDVHGVLSQSSPCMTMPR